MKFVKFLSLITIIIYAPVLYSMEDNTLQEQSRVPKLIDLCRPGAIEQINSIINQQYAKPNTYAEAVELLNNMNSKFPIADLGLADKLYNSSEIFQHCIDLIINEIWNQCQKVTGATLDTIIHETRQNLLSRISKELLSFIEAHFCKQKGWHVPYCLKEFNNVQWINFSPNSSLMFVKYLDGRGESINTKTGKVIKVFNNVADIPPVYFSQDSSLIFVWYGDNREELIDAKTGKVIKEFNNVADISPVYFSQDSSLIFVWYRDYRRELIDAKTGNVIKEFDNVGDVKFSPDSSLMLVSYIGGTGKSIIDAKTGEVIKRFNNVFRFFKFSPDSLFMFVKYRDGRGELIDANSGAVIKDDVAWVYFSPDSSLMFIEYRDGREELIDAKTGSVIKKLNNVHRFSFSPDGSMMFVSYRDNDGNYGEELINAKSGSVIKKLGYWVKFSPNSLMVFVRYMDDDENDRGKLINAKSGSIIKKFGHVFEVYFSPNSSLLFIIYSRDNDGNNRGELIDTKTGEVIKEFNNVYDISFSPDSSLMLVSYIGDTGKSIIDAKTGEVIKNNVWGVNFSPNSSMMFVRYWDNRGELIDAKTREVTRDNVDWITFTPNSSLMFVWYRGGRKELLLAGNFEQIIFKCALRNTLKAYKNNKSIWNKIIRNIVPVDSIKHSLITLLNHSTLKTFPQQAQKQLSKEIIDVLKNMGLEFRGLAGILLNNP